MPTPYKLDRVNGFNCLEKPYKFHTKSNQRATLSSKYRVKSLANAIQYIGYKPHALRWRLGFATLSCSLVVLS